MVDIYIPLGRISAPRDMDHRRKFLDLYGIYIDVSFDTLPPLFEATNTETENNQKTILIILPNYIYL